MNKLIFKLFYLKCPFRALLALFLLFLAGCNIGITGKSISAIPNETSANPEVYFCPREDCGKILEAQINSANSSVHCALYNINLKNVINALAKKSKSIDVKIVMDNDNQKGQVKGDGIRIDNDNQLMHNKFCVFDRNRIITGSFNPTLNDNDYNNNNIILVHSSTIAENYEDEFKELWGEKFGSGDSVRHPVFYINGVKFENYFCPEDNCAKHVISLINNADRSVYFMAFSFTSESIGDAIIKKNSVDIRGIFDSEQSSSKFSQLERMKGFGVDVKKDKGKHKMHHKVFIIDNETVVTGSFNPTLSADTKNDENLLVIHDKKIAELYLNEFDSLWN